MKKSFVLVALASLVVSGYAWQQQKGPDPAAMKAKSAEANKRIAAMLKASQDKANQYWKPAKTTAAALAKQIAMSTKGAKNLYCYSQLIVQTSDGHGIYKGEIKVGSATRYKVDYVQIRPDPQNGVLLADGATRRSMLSGKVSPPLPLTQPFPDSSSNAATLVERFPNEFSRFMFQGATDGRDAWTPLITGWSQGMGGYAMKLQERKIVFNNRTFHNYRILLERTPAAAKKLGKSTVEVVFDASRYLPVTVRETRVDLKGKEWIIQWAGQYKFDQKFTAADFRFNS
jgi:hypothetical protein